MTLSMRIERLERRAGKGDEDFVLQINGQTVTLPSTITLAQLAQTLWKTREDKDYEK